jgi:hypothetical protein
MSRTDEPCVVVMWTRDNVEPTGSYGPFINRWDGLAWALANLPDSDYHQWSLVTLETPTTPLPQEAAA